MMLLGEERYSRRSSNGLDIVAMRTLNTTMPSNLGWIWAVANWSIPGQGTWVDVDVILGGNWAVANWCIPSHGTWVDVDVILVSSQLEYTVSWNLGGWRCNTSR